MADKPKQVAVVTWQDSYHTQSDFETEIEIESEDDSYVIQTVGWLIRDSEKTIAIAMDWEPTSGSFREVRRIRKENIQSIKILTSEG